MVNARCDGGRESDASVVERVHQEASCFPGHLCFVGQDGRVVGDDYCHRRSGARGEGWSHDGEINVVGDGRVKR